MMLHAAALDGAPFAQGDCDALYAAIEVNDRIDLAAPLPAMPPPDAPDRLVDGFRLSRQLWKTGVDRTALTALVATSRATGDLGPDDRLAFKHARAKFKHLRFAFVLYRAVHRCPPAFKAATTAMGHLQDAFRHGRRDAAVRHATLLHLSLTRPAFAWLLRETDRLAPADGHGFARFRAAEMARLRAMLGSDAMTSHDFHKARKIVSRQVSYHDDMRTILAAEPAATGHAAMARYLATINGLMGGLHDALVLDRTRGDIDYARTAVPLPPDIRDRLAAMLALYG